MTGGIHDNPHRAHGIPRHHSIIVTTESPQFIPSSDIHRRIAGHLRRDGDRPLGQPVKYGRGRFRQCRQQGLSAESYLKQFKLEKRNHKPLLAVVSEKSLGIDDYDSWNWKLMCEVRTKLTATRIPFFPTMERAATAARKFVEYYQANGEPDKI